MKKKKRGGRVEVETDAVPADQAAYEESVRQLAAELGAVEPNYVGVRQGGNGTYDGEVMHAKEKAEDSVVHVLQMVAKISFSPSRSVAMAPLAVELRRTVDFSPEDRAGTDIEMVFSDEFSEFTGFDRVGIQCKSSETGVDVFQATGEKKFGAKGDAWIEAGRILLDGQWPDNTIVADFLIQLMNLMRIWGHKEEVADFLSCLDAETVTAYNRAYLQVEQYRAGLLAWVAGGPAEMNGGKTRVW